MSQKRGSRYCPEGDRTVLAVGGRTNHIHLIMTIITVGVWGLVIWLPM